MTMKFVTSSLLASLCLQDHDELNAYGVPPFLCLNFKEAAALWPLRLNTESKAHSLTALEHFQGGATKLSITKPLITSILNMCTQAWIYTLCNSCDITISENKDGAKQQCSRYPHWGGTEDDIEYKSSGMCSACAIEAKADQQQDRRRGSAAARDRYTTSAYSVRILARRSLMTTRGIRRDRQVKSAG